MFYERKAKRDEQTIEAAITKAYQAGWRASKQSISLNADILINRGVTPRDLEDL